MKITTTITINDPKCHKTNNQHKTAAMMMSKAAVLLLFLFSTHLVGAADEDEGPPKMQKVDNDSMGGSPCPDFKCTGGLAVVPKSRAVKFEAYGCNDMSSMFFQMGGNDRTDKPYETCCNQWSACYQVCGASKEVCDTTFSTCTKEICGADADCTQSAKISHMGLKFGGCERYDQAQYKACECVTKEKVMEKRETVIRKFYKKHSPDSVDKAPDLAKKADTVGKMASLLRKLIKKYPESIQIKADPKLKEMEEMDEMMRKAGENVKIGEDGEEEVTEEEATEDENIEL
jgi:hypothetical protein